MSTETHHDDNIHRVNEKADEIGKKFEKTKAMKGLLDQGMVMIDMIKDYAKGNYREVPYWAIGAVALALLYVLNPIDVIPDVLVGLGYLDDATVVAFALKLIDTELNRYKTWREKRDAEAGAQPTGKVVDV